MSMFEKIKQRINKALEEAKKKQELTNEKISHAFNDDVANKTQWTPLKSGGANFKTHDLVKPSSSILKYQLSWGSKMLFGVFSLIGIVALSAGIFQLMEKGTSSGWVLVFVGLLFIVISLVFFKIMGRPIFIDRSIGMMYKGNKAPKLSGQQDNNDKVYLNNVHALQVIKEYIRSNKSRYYSYEINFIMKDASRVNVMDHGNYKQIQSDAEEIALFIGKPLWDATQF